MKKQHPIALLQYTTKNFWLLLIPLLRGLFALGFDFYRWLSGAYLDVLVILFILGAAFFRWCNIKYEIQENGILITSGMFVHEEFYIPYRSMSSVTSKRTLWLRPIKAVVIFIETDSFSALNKPSDPDVKLTLDIADYKYLFKKLPKQKCNVKFTYKAPKAKLLLFSFVFSSTLSGLVYIGAFLFQGGKLVGKELESRFILAVNDVTEIAGKVIKGLTPITVGIIIVIGVGWLYSFTSNYLRHINFKIQRCGKSIFVKNGFFSKWKYHINTERINYADLRQTLLMKIGHVMSVHASCSGYGKSRNEIPVFVPITTKSSVIGVMRILLPEFSLNKAVVNPRCKYIMRFIGPPTAFIFGVMAAAFVMIIIFPEWYSVIFFAAIMGEILSFHLLIVKLTAFYTTGIGCGSDTLNVRYCRFFQFHHIIVPKEQVTSVKIRQTIFQKMNSSCDFIVCTRGEKVTTHRVRGLNLSDVKEFIFQLGYGQENPM